MSAKRLKIDLYVDVVSPYSFLAFEVLHRYKELWNLEIIIKPAFLGGVMKATGNNPPGKLTNKLEMSVQYHHSQRLYAAYLPAKGAYLQFDIERLGKHFG